MRNVLFLLILIFASSCKFNYSTNVEWIEVLSPKAGFKVKCPQKLNVLDNISVKSDEKNVDKNGFLSCRSQDKVFYVHSMKWDVSENNDENVNRFFESLIGYGVANSTKTNVHFNL